MYVCGVGFSFVSIVLHYRLFLTYVCVKWDVKRTSVNYTVVLCELTIQTDHPFITSTRRIGCKNDKIMFCLTGSISPCLDSFLRTGYVYFCMCIL